MEIIPTLKHFLSTEITAATRNIQEIDPDEDLLAEGIIDSMILLKLVSFIEETFSVKVLDEDVTHENFRSFKSIEAFIEQKQKS